MAYPNQYQPYQYQYAPQVQPPMDRLAQLQAQQYQVNQPMQQPAQSNQSLIYVQGEAAAKSWMVGAGQSVLLMDSENPVFYIKSADASGIPLPLRVFDYVERNQSVTQNAIQSTNPTQIDLDGKYVTRAEYDDLQGKYIEILDRLNNFPSPVVSSDDGKRPAATGNKSRSRGGANNE